MEKQPLVTALCLLLLATAATHRVLCNDLDGFEDSEEADAPDDGFGALTDAMIAARAAELDQQAATQDTPAETAAAQGGSAAATGGSNAGASASTLQAASRASASPPGKSIFPKYFLEAAMGCFFILYLVKFFSGKLHNEAIATEWGTTFCTDGAVLERNFSLLGIAEGEILMKDSHSCFKLYASGRRFCQGMLATLELRNRQDLLSYLLYLVMPKEDTLEVEVYMNDANMPPMVFAIGDPLTVKRMQRERSDLSKYTKLVNLRDRIPKIAADRFACYAESKEMSADIISMALDDLIVESAWASAGKYMESIVVSSESTEGTHSKIIKAIFKIPPSGKMSEMEGVINAIPSLIDAVGSYKMSADMRKRAEDRRRKAAEEAFNTKEKREERQEIIARKKAEKLAAEKERLSRMTPEARAKAQEKQEKLQQRRNVKTRVKMVK